MSVIRIALVCERSYRCKRWCRFAVFTPSLGGALALPILLGASSRWFGSGTNKARNDAERKIRLAMVYRLCVIAERGFIRLNGSELIEDVIAGTKHENGVDATAA